MAEKPSLTETICFAVSTAGDLPTLVGDCPKPWPQSVIGLLRGFLEALDRDLKASNSLVERAAEFRGHYATPPEPIAGHSAASYHELGRNLAMEVLHRVMEAANPYASFILSPDPLTQCDFDRVLDNLPQVEKYLRDKAPRFDWPLLVARIQDEEAKAKRCAPDDSPELPPANAGKRQRERRPMRKRQSATMSWTGKATTIALSRIANRMIPGPLDRPKGCSAGTNSPDYWGCLLVWCRTQRHGRQSRPTFSLPVPVMPYPKSITLAAK